MAWQMGMDPEELGPEAENIWKMLDQLATDDPTEYQEYIKKTLEEKAEFDSRPDVPHFIPEPGFVIKGLTAKGIKTFINVCGHGAVQHPTAHNGKPMTNDPRQPTDGCEIPMAVGDKRNCEDHAGSQSAAVDVVVNPWVLTRAADDQFFKVSISDLAASAVGSEQGLQIKKPYKFIQSRYKGGGGELNNKPVPFIVPSKDGKDEASSTKAVVPARPAASPSAPAAQPKPAATAKLPIEDLDDPKELFGMLGDLSDHDGIGSGKQKKESEGLIQELNVPNMSATKPVKQSKFNKNKKPLISEIGEDTESSAIIEDLSEETDAPKVSSSEKPSGQKKKQGKPVVKKGFLFSKSAKKAKPLYEKGSEEGRGEHPWNKLMGRSKVVDMNDMTPEQQAAYAKDGTVPKNIGKTSNDSNGTAKKDDYADAEFEELMQIADPDYGLEAKNRRAAGQEMNDEMARWTELMNPDLMGSSDASSTTAEKLKEDLKAQAAEKRRLKKEKKAKQKRPGTTDYSNFEEISEDADLMDSDEKVTKLRQKRKQLELKIKEEQAQEQIREQERQFKEQQRLERERKKKERADLRPGTLDYSKFEEIDENSELLDQKEAAARHVQEEERKRQAEEDQTAAIAVAKEAARFKGEQAQVSKPNADTDGKGKNKVLSMDVTDTATTPEAGSILEIGADGTFDFDAAAGDAKKDSADTTPAFNLKGKLGVKSSSKKGSASGAQKSAPQTSKESSGLPIPGHRVKRVKGDVPGTHKYCVIVELPGLSSMSGVELDVSAKLVRLKAKGYGELKVALNEIVDENRVAAKFSKKKRELTVKVPIL